MHRPQELIFLIYIKTSLSNDPFYRDNENKLQWIEKEDWEYTAIFQVSQSELQDNKIELVFDGLDTYADISVNGHNIFSANNMFVQWKVEIKAHLIPGNNEICIFFHSPLKKVASNNNGIIYPAGNDRSEEKLSVFTRKAPYHFGWDWGPRFVTSGIWRPVYLKFSNFICIEDISITYEILDNKASLKCSDYN